MSVSADDLENLYRVKPAGQPARSLTSAEAGIIARYLDRVEAAVVAGQHIPISDALDRVIDRFDLLAAVEDFVVGDGGGPYGTADLGYQLMPRGGLDLDDERLVWLDRDRSFSFTSWTSEDESWEEDQYSENPWPKIEADGPENYDGAIWTPDYVRFYEFRGPWMAGKGRTPGKFIFAVDVRQFMQDPAEDPSDYDFKPDDAGWWEEFLLAWMRYARSEHPDAFFWHGDDVESLSDFHHYRGPDGAADDPGQRGAFERAQARYRTELALAARQLSFILVPMGADYVPQPIDWGRFGARPQRGDLWTDHLFAKAKWGVVLYVLGEPSLPAAQIARTEIAAGHGWTRIAEVLLAQSAREGRKVRLWSGAPNSDPRTWILVEVGAPPGPLSGLRRPRRLP